MRPSFTPLGIWAFSIGTSIGWGSFIVTCNTYLQKSGILGTVFGLLIGMAVIMVIAWNLQYMIRNSPDAGGIYTFEKRVAGKDFGFLAAWFVLLTYLAVLWANITSLPPYRPGPSSASRTSRISPRNTRSRLRGCAES